eukprot:5301503-Pyramimonas_sp.AAC.1
MPALLALHDVLEELRRMLPLGAEAIAYLDDIYMLCDPDETNGALELVTHILWNRRHVDINIGKLAVWDRTPDPCPADQDPTVAVAWKYERGIVMLGAPFSSIEFINAHGAKIAEEKGKLLDILPKFPSLQ